MKLKDLASELGISLESLQNFIYDFNIDLGGCIDEHFNLTEVFREFALKNKEFLKKYALDHSKLKTLADIAQTIGVKRSEEHTSELQSRPHLVCRLLLEKKNKM